MALNFGILQPVNIGGQIMAGEQEAQRNQLAQQQLKTGEMQQEKAGLELRRFKRGQDGLDVFLRESTANGKTGSPEAQTDSFYKFALTQGDPTLIMAAQQLNQAAKERSAYQASRTPGALAAPAIAPTPELPGVTVGGPNPPTVFGAAPTANRLALAPTPAASVNRLGVDTNALQTRIDELRSTYPNVPQAQKEADRLEKQLDRLNTTAPDAMLMQQLGYPLTQAGYQAFREAQRTERPDRLLTPAEEAQKMRLAVAGRAPAQPRAEAAPSITTIIDPTDSSKMITVDARRYTGGGVGSPGVIGVGGKEPGAALRVDKAQAGKTQLADDLYNLRASFTRLDELRAIPSTERNVVSNLMSAAGSSGIGQTFGRAGGSSEQVERDVINSARQRLISSIKNATGMSARSLDSNVELKTMLNSISDPSQSFQAAMRIIDDIENAYVKGDGMLPKRDQQVPQSAIDALKSGKGTDAQFDEIFGAGAAKRARGGK